MVIWEDGLKKISVAEIRKKRKLNGHPQVAAANPAAPKGQRLTVADCRLLRTEEAEINACPHLKGVKEDTREVVHGGEMRVPFVTDGSVTGPSHRKTDADDTTVASYPLLVTRAQVAQEDEKDQWRDQVLEGISLSLNVLYYLNTIYCPRHNRAQFQN